MKEGFYSIVFIGEGGDKGVGLIVLYTGLVVGADEAGGKYDGTYEFNPRSEMIDIDIVVTIPPGVQTVMGAPALPEKTQFPIKASFPRETPEHPIQVNTPFGPIKVVVRFLRGFPD